MYVLSTAKELAKLVIIIELEGGNRPEAGSK